MYKAPEVSTCGCTSGPYRNLYATVKALKNDNIIEVYQRVIFVDPSTGKGYTDKARTQEIGDLERNTLINGEILIIQLRIVLAI